MTYRRNMVRPCNKINAKNVTLLHFSYISCDFCCMRWTKNVTTFSQEMYEKCNDVTLFAFVTLFVASEHREWVGPSRTSTPMLSGSFSVPIPHY